MHPHQLSIDDALRELHSSRTARQQRRPRCASTYGPNELEERARTTPLMLFLGQFANLMIVVYRGGGDPGSSASVRHPHHHRILV